MSSVLSFDNRRRADAADAIIIDRTIRWARFMDNLQIVVGAEPAQFDLIEHTVQTLADQIRARLATSERS